MLVYFASPFFNEEQVEREERLKKALRATGMNVWSPKENCYLPPSATQSERDQVYSANIAHIELCDVVFAVTDGKDMGTIWEAGYAAGIGKPIIYYCETLGTGQFNLMLAQSGNEVITEFEDLENKIKVYDMFERAVDGFKSEFEGRIE